MTHQNQLTIGREISRDLGISVSFRDKGLWWLIGLIALFLLCCLISIILAFITVLVYVSVTFLVIIVKNRR